MEILKLYFVSEGMAGGWSEVDSNDAEVEDIVEFYLGETNRALGTLNLKKVESQIVAGTNYRLTFYVSL